MVAPLLAVSMAAVSPKAPSAPPAVAPEPGLPAGQDFSRLLAAERSGTEKGGEKLPPATDRMPVQAMAGKGLPGQGAPVVGADAKVAFFAETVTAETVTAVPGEAPAAIPFEPAPADGAQVHQDAGFPPAAQQAQPRAAASERAVLKGASGSMARAGESAPVQGTETAQEQLAPVPDQSADKAGVATAAADTETEPAPATPDAKVVPLVPSAPPEAASTDDPAPVPEQGSAANVPAQEPDRPRVQPDRPGAETRSPGASGVEPTDSGLDGQVVPESVDIQTLMSSIAMTTEQPLPAVVVRALQAQQRRLESVDVPALGRVEGVPVAGMAGLTAPATTPLPLVADVAGAGAAEAVAGGRALPELVADQARLHQQMQDVQARQAGAVDKAAGAVAAGTDTLADDAGSTLAPAATRLAVDGLKGGPALTPSPSPNPAPGLSQSLPAGLSPGNAAWGQAVSDRVLLMTANQLQVAEIRLDPPELGTLHVRLQLNQDQASLVFTSAHGSVRDALEQQMPRLRDMLAEQGFNLENSSVADDSERRGRSFGEAQGEGGPMTEPADEPVFQAQPAVALSRSLVDEFA